jgi:uncharacterized protein (TIGR00725 family)
MRKYIVSVIGSGDILKDTKEYNIAYEIGAKLIENGYRVLTGGLGGVMEAASKGAKSSTKHQDGDIIGILPGLHPSESNPYVDIPIATGLGISRNVIVANSDAVVAVSGSSGTLSEIALSWQMGKLILAYKKTNGWSSKLADTSVDSRKRITEAIPDKIYGFDTPEEAIKILEAKLQYYIVKR